MEWLEAEGESVDDAVKAAVDALGVESPEQVTVEVLREPKKGFLGLGSQMALVKVTQKPARRRRRRGGKGGEGKGGDGSRERSGGRSGGRSDSSKAKDSASGRPSSSGGSSRSNASSRSGSQEKSSQGSRSSGRSGSGSKSSKSRDGSKQKQNRPDNKQGSKSNRPSQEAAVTDNNRQDNEPKASIEEQAQVAVDFLEGLVQSFGLEGEVTSRIEDDVLYLNVDGDTEALVGNRGVILQSVLELTRTVVQRKTFGAPRMRIDIAGYAERRRAALQIYAGQLADKVKAEGGEVMLEPMNPADRKVVHDAIGEIDGVRSFSEGEDPNRSVVVAPAE